jgi:hypothetical protein
MQKQIKGKVTDRFWVSFVDPEITDGSHKA